MQGVLFLPYLLGGKGELDSDEILDEDLKRRIRAQECVFDEALHSRTSISCWL